MTQWNGSIFLSPFRLGATVLFQPTIHGYGARLRQRRRREVKTNATLLRGAAASGVHHAVELVFFVPLSLVVGWLSDTQALALRNRDGTLVLSTRECVCWLGFGRAF
jgi:hypothetical protein